MGQSGTTLTHGLSLSGGRGTMDRANNKKNISSYSVNNAKAFTTISIAADVGAD
jgi:hypothetical protein